MTYYETPIDKPLGIDIGQFIESSSTNNSTSDEDLINEAMKQHPLIENILTCRQRNMKIVQKWWHMGNVNSAINSLSQ